MRLRRRPYAPSASIRLRRTHEPSQRLRRNLPLLQPTQPHHLPSQTDHFLHPHLLPGMVPAHSECRRLLNLNLLPIDLCRYLFLHILCVVMVMVLMLVLVLVLLSRKATRRADCWSLPALLCLNLEKRCRWLCCRRRLRHPSYGRHRRNRCCWHCQHRRRLIETFVAGTGYPPCFSARSVQE